MNTRRKITFSTAGMADISFLLLIFFLVTTSIEEDQGILLRLPPYIPEVESLSTSHKDVLRIFLNAENRIIIDKDEVAPSAVSAYVYDFLSGNDSQAGYARQGIISLVHSAESQYGPYIELYDQILSAYSQLRNERSHGQFKEEYLKLNDQQKKEINSAIPLRISETEYEG